MKKLLLLLLIIPFTLSAQKTTLNVTYDGLSRTYIQYIPSTYDGNTEVPVVFSLHGLGGSASSFSNAGFEQLAEQHNFIVITPQAIMAPAPISATAWNSGAGQGPFVLNGSVDDVGFLSFIMDSLENNFNINTDRIYSTGFSMGSFMSHRLACELNDRIAAIASVAGAIGGGLDCQPARSVPMCHFHGTADGTVAYTGNLFGSDAPETVSFWVDNNNCDATPDSTNLPDLVEDGISITHYVYQNCDTDVEFYSAVGAEHDWLNATENDISYTQKIWEFLARQSLPQDECGDVSVDLGDDVQAAIGEPVMLDATTAEATYSWSTGETTATITVTTPGTYTVEIRVGDCIVSDSVFVDFVTGLFNIGSSFEFSIYPNPMSQSGKVKIHAIQNSSLNISIVDVIGKQVQTSTIEITTGENIIPIELANLAKGTYILNLEKGGEKASRPFMVH